MAVNRRTAVVAGFLFAAACSLGTSPEDRLRDDLSEARRRWAAMRLHDYVYGIERLCFCPDDWRGPVRVTVRGDEVVERLYEGSSIPVPPDIALEFPGVSGLFRVIEEALDSRAARVDVVYDEETGVPTEFFIDYDERAVDEELGYRVTRPVQAIEAGFQR